LRQKLRQAIKITELWQSKLIIGIYNTNYEGKSLLSINMWNEISKDSKTSAKFHSDILSAMLILKCEFILHFITRLEFWEQVHKTATLWNSLYTIEAQLYPQECMLINSFDFLINAEKKMYF